MTENNKPLIRETPITYDEYAKLPEDGNRYEIVDGMLELMSPGPNMNHQWISGEMEKTIDRSCGEEYFIFHAPFDLILSQKDVRQPDIAMVHRSRLDIIAKRGIIGIPDLVAEILSPFSIRRDRVSKLNSYAKYGIPEYWIVDPANCCLEQYILQNGALVPHNVYERDQPVRSDHIRCVSFTMQAILDKVPDLPE